MLKPISMMTII